MTALPRGIADWARLAGPAAVIDAVRTRARRGHHTERGTLTTLVLDGAQRREVALLLGTRWDLSGGPVRLQDLAARLAEHGLTVRALGEALHGTVEPDRALRDRARTAADAERGRAALTVAAAGVEPAVVDRWLADPGLPRPGSGALTDLADQVAAVLEALPRDDDSHVRLARLAADVLHDAHALDHDRPLGRAVARLVAGIHGLPRPQRAGRTWRAAWAAGGIVCDGVSSRVLVLNLPLVGDAPVARLCAATPGEPLWLTLRVLNGIWAVPAVDVYICENPTVVEAAADTLGTACPPLVCTDGIASGAALDLLAGVAAAGCTLHVRADFDTAGLTIADQVLSVAPAALPWRFDAPTYATVCGLDGHHVGGPTLATAVPALRELYDRTRIPVHEERLLPHLLSDLTLANRGTPTAAQAPPPLP
jgi:uncharacterized protein (TIGR02679 family)